MKLSQLQQARLTYKPHIPECIQNPLAIDFIEGDSAPVLPEVALQFQKLSAAKKLTLSDGSSNEAALTVGVVLSGGQAPGGHNVIAGLFDALATFSPKSRLIGFLGGPSGIVKNSSVEITSELLSTYRNQGGFDIIGSGRTKIETPDQFAKALNSCKEHDLDGLVVIGGDDSNTNAAFLAEYFLNHGCKTAVVGVPKTIDGDLKNSEIELSFGFDTACKTYCEIIGNIARDAASAKKYYYFVKLMGRSASHITLECALQCQPNLALIGEEVQSQSLEKVVADIVSLIEERAKFGKEYGVILIPEGIIEFLPDMKALIKELNFLVASAVTDNVREKLSDKSKTTFEILPEEFQKQLLLDRDPHGNVQVSKIETERLLISLVTKALNVKMSAQPIFCGYEGRSALPSNFDANYCYALGRLAAVAIRRKRTGYIVSFKNLKACPSQWQAAVSPLISMLNAEVRDGKSKLVIEKALVNLTDKAFIEFAKRRVSWRLDDCYCQVGPIQFFGPEELTDSVPLTL
jgi:pyrophosphate--fructose-6-phosphate 1-phosphotransferase